MNKIVVTGGAGFIGFHLVKKLLEDKNNHVTIVDNFSVGKMDKDLAELCSQNPGTLQTISSDLYLEKLFWGIQADQVYHMDGAIGTKDLHGDPFKVIELNTIGMLNVLYCLGMKGAKIVFASTNEVYAGMTSLMPSENNTEDSPIGFDDLKSERWSYAISKFIGETLISRFSYNKDFRYSIARLSNVYGPRMFNNYAPKSFIERALAHENPMTVINCDDTRPFTYVSDTVDGLILLMNRKMADGETFNIGNPISVSVGDLAKTVCEVVGYTPEFKLLPANYGKPELRQANIEKAKTLGFDPKVSLKEGIIKTVDWYKKNG